LPVTFERVGNVSPSVWKLDYIRITVFSYSQVLGGRFVKGPHIWCKFVRRVKLVALISIRHRNHVSTVRVQTLLKTRYDPHLTQLYNYTNMAVGTNIIWRHSV